MDIQEFEKVQAMNYLEYCNYLQQKYGIGLCDYFTANWSKKAKVTRTKEGLIAHHKFEDHAVMLSTPEYAKKNPFEWQKAHNIVYCNYLEHLFLHILICENPAKEKNEFEIVGFGGVMNFIMPELNDFYSGWITAQEWRRNCLNVIADCKDTYLALVKRFKEKLIEHNINFEPILFTSYNEKYGIWSKDKNKEIFDEIQAL